MAALRIGHFTCGLNPFGTERLVEMLLRYRSAPFADQFVVSYWDGPMQRVFESLGVSVRVSRDPEQVARWLREADLLNVHLLFPSQFPECLAGSSSPPRVITIHWSAPFPSDQADHFIATSHGAFTLQPDPGRCTVIPNGVDLERFNGRRVETENRVLVRICRPEKCAEYFWYAVTPVLAEYPDTELWLAGVSMETGRRVRPLGVLDDVAEVLAHSSLFLHTPRPGEGSRDLSIMEAMAMGVPPVAADVPCVRESAGGADGATLVPYEDVPRFSAALRRLLDDREAAAETGRRARRYAVEHFDMRPRVAEYERLYERVLAGRGG